VSNEIYIAIVTVTAGTGCIVGHNAVHGELPPAQQKSTQRMLLRLRRRDDQWYTVNESKDLDDGDGCSTKRRRDHDDDANVSDKPENNTSCARLSSSDASQSTSGTAVELKRGNRKKGRYELECENGFANVRQAVGGGQSDRRMDATSRENGAAPGGVTADAAVGARPSAASEQGDAQIKGHDLAGRAAAMVLATPTADLGFVGLALQRSASGLSSAPNLSKIAAASTPSMHRSEKESWSLGALTQEASMNPVSQLPVRRLHLEE